ncbi:hypothetical protein CAPTEDRAFT_216123 [Capitella teleta]|uniref:G-protein coupled receptors family 1 profile domain-containing protein n=1 Tax=Capitella teleta TaxID=283909 RepID=R7U3B6_CAPTE|nr:hypothetical protein CAPTEDRAFT_216123 [Capitella teleta]|eukprot:ELT97670.1 hypothetical protein CAPTEDRAFT_216123 [Capitella teleta]
MGISGTCITYNVVVETSRWCLFAFILISNTLTITTMLRTKQGIGQKGKWYIVSLSLADILLSPAIGIDAVMNRFGVYCPEISEEAVWRKRVIYIGLGILYVQSLGSALLTLVSIAIDRFVAISKPIFYKNHVSPFRIRCVLALEWTYMFSFITAMLVHYGWHTDEIQVLRSYEAMQVMPTWCYTVLKVQVYAIIFGNIVFYATTVRLIKKLDSGSISHKSFERTKRYLKMSGVTLATMLALWAPYIAVNFYVEYYGQKGLPWWLAEYGIQLAYSLMFCNSWVNPFFYCWLNKDYRAAFMAVLGIGKSKVHSEGSMTEQC